MVSYETETTKLQKIQDNIEETIDKKKIKVLYHYCDIFFAPFQLLKYLLFKLM